MPSAISPPLSRVINRCIYCGTTEGKLTDEHVLPHSLYGKIQLRSASCDRCQKIIHKYETVVTSAMLGAIRQGRGFSSRPAKRAKDRRPPGTCVNVLKDDGTVERRFVPAPDLPKFTFRLPHFMVPPNALKQLLPNDWNTDSRNHHAVWDATDPTELADQRAKYGGVFDTKVDEKSFAKELAKIAHGFVISALGLEGITLYLNKYIISEGFDETLFDYVGHGFAWEYPEGLLDVENPVAVTLAMPPMADGRRLLLVHVFLLSNFNTPIYSIVAGECSADFGAVAKQPAGS